MDNTFTINRLCNVIGEIINIGDWILSSHRITNILCFLPPRVSEIYYTVFTLGFFYAIIFEPARNGGLDMNLSRLESLIGEDGINKIKNSNILVIGLGGVGGYTVESLIRSGLENITIVDGDTIKPSNINRQIIVTTKNMNKYKTKE